MPRTMVWALAGLLFGASGLLAQQAKEKDTAREKHLPCAVGHITLLDPEKDRFTVQGKTHEHEVYCTGQTGVVHEPPAAHRDAGPGEKPDGGHLTCAALRQGMLVTIFGEHKGDHWQARLVVIHDEHDGPGPKPGAVAPARAPTRPEEANPAARPAIRGAHAQIADVYPDKARYDPGTDARVSVDLHYTGKTAVRGELRLKISRLVRTAAEFSEALTLQPGERRTVTFTWKTPADHYCGYGVDADLVVGGQTVSSRSSGLDVSKDFVPFPRYGYLTDFHPGQPDDRLDWEIANLSKHHINLLQYYDWMWTHDRLIPYDARGRPVDTYEDLFGSKKSLAKIRRKIRRGHERGIEAMAYDLLYGDSGHPDGPKHIEWAAFTAPRKTGGRYVRNHIKKIWVMDVSNEAWQSHIFGQFKNAMRELGFDGIHLDNLGGAVNYKYNSDRLISEKTAFPSFIKNCKRALRGQNPQARLSHNDVYAGYLKTVAPAPTDFYYAEVWGRKRFLDLRDLIMEAKAAGGRDKAVVLAAYINRDDPPPDYINEASVRLLDACVFANGAFHIELGDGDRMLINEYWPLHRTMHDTLKRAMRDYYSFIVRYENFLFYNTLGGVRDGTQGMQIASPTHALSKDARPGTIWTVARVWDGRYDTVSLINLNGGDDRWRHVRANPAFQSDVQVKYYLDQKCRQVLLATPDDGLGRPLALPFSEGRDAGGYYVRFTVPSLRWWDLLIFDKTSRDKTER